MASFWLEYTQDGQRREFSFDAGSVTIGRDKAADFVLDHPTVSRQHALIRADQRGHQLVVLSRGGLTAIDGGQVQGEVPLYDGSEIHFGQLSFTFRSTSAPPKPVAQQRPQMGGFNASSVAPAGQASPAADNGNGYGSATDWDAPNGNSWDDAGWDDVPARAEPAAPQSGGIVTWDQIANSAEAQDNYKEGDDALTDFQRIQAAQAKADKQTKGNNPFIVYGGVLGILALVVYAVWPASNAVIVDGPDVDKKDQPFIKWSESDIDCVGKANCRKAAIDAYKVGKNLAEQAGADITNPYESFKQFDRAQRLLKHGKIDKVPDEMKDVTTWQAKVKSGLDDKFTQARINYLNHEKRKMYRAMADELNKLQAYFPDKRCLYNQWAVAKEREMKENQVYPASPILY